MKKLSLLDLVFFLVESEESPKHVGGLMRCQKPRGAPANYARELFEELKAFEEATEPFNLVINFLGVTGPRWELCQNFSIENHLFYHRSRKAISWNDAKEKVSLLHEPMLDRSRPLWEFHLIDNIRGAQFAVYTKVHHAYADGVTMTSWMTNMLADSPDDMTLTPVWAIRPPKRLRSRTPGEPSLLGTARKFGGMAFQQLVATGGVLKLGAQQSLERLGVTRDTVSKMFNTPRDTPMTGSASPGRHIATSSVEMERVRELCRLTCSTLNHVALSCIDGAMHKYLGAQGITLDHPVSIQMPVNLRNGDSSGSGNRIGITVVDLAKPTHDPYRRLREVGYKLSNVKNQVASVPGASFEQFTILAAGVSEVIDKLQLTDRLPTNGHAVVSNVPGPKEMLYLKGSRVERNFPISTLSPGLRLNITMFSYAGILHFGLVSTHDLENLQDLADQITKEFELLENAVKKAG